MQLKSNIINLFMKSVYSFGTYSSVLLFKIVYTSVLGGGVAVKALRYKPAGRGFDSRWYHWNFSVT
jgi:hypothetical protein